MKTRGILSAAIAVAVGVMAASSTAEELVIAVVSENTTLGSEQAYQEVNSPGLRNIFEMLVTRDPKTNELIPELATSWRRIDQTTWEFQLREGVIFHDGSPFNAEAAAYGINFSFGDEQGFGLRSFMGPQITAEAVSEYTLHVITEQPDPLVPERMSATALPSMQALLTSRDTYETQPVGTGPYQLREWRRGQYLLLEAYPDWWGLDEPTIENPEFETVRFYFRPESSVRASMVQTGEAQIAQFIDSDQCAQLSAVEGVDCRSAPSVETLFIRLDTPSTILADERVRRAVLQAIDAPTIISAILGGLATPAAQIVGPASTGHDPSLQPVVYDPEAARALLAAAKADGVPVDETELIINVRQAALPRIEEIAQVMQAMLTDVGLNVGILIREASIFNPEFRIKATPERHYLTVHPVGNDFMDAASSFGTFATCERGHSGICDETLDAMISEASAMVGEERAEALMEISQYIQDRAYMGFIAHLDLAYGVSEDLDWEVPLDHRFIVRNMGLAD